MRKTSFHFPSPISLIALCVLPVALGACLQTRGAQKEEEEKVVLRKQLTTLQHSNADASTRFQDMEDETRKLNGRVESLEAKLQQNSQRFDKLQQASDAKDKEIDDAFKEELQKLKEAVAHLSEQVAAMQEDSRREAKIKADNDAAAAARAAEAAKNPFAAAEEKFEKGDWKAAILDYEKYRSQNPKGRSFATATFKIGASFQELGMTDEAKAFYDEVVAKFPKSKDAAKATTKLKSLKKKK